MDQLKLEFINYKRIEWKLYNKLLYSGGKVWLLPFTTYHRHYVLPLIPHLAHCWSNEPSIGYI